MKRKRRSMWHRKRPKYHGLVVSLTVYFVRDVFICGGEEVLREKGREVPSLIDLIHDSCKAIREAGWVGHYQTNHVELVDKALWKGEKAHKTGYASAVLENATVEPGDCVAVR
jgi:hypothetical protein